MAPQAPAFPFSDLTCDRLILRISTGCASGAQPRACGYIIWKAWRPVNGSGGFSGALVASEVLGASEHADSSRTSGSNIRARASVDIPPFSHAFALSASQWPGLSGL